MWPCGMSTDGWGSDFSTGEYPPNGGHNHTLIVRRDEPDRYPRGRDPFLGRWLFSRRVVFVLLALALFIVARYGGWYFTTGRYATVPSVASDAPALATDMLTAQGFKVMSATGSQHSNTIPKGEVVGTNPSGRASEAIPIELPVSDGPFTSVVPAVKGKTRNTAEAELTSVHLQYTVTQVGSTLPVGTVVSVSPKAGASYSRRPSPCGSRWQAACRCPTSPASISSRPSSRPSRTASRSRSPAATRATARLSPRRAASPARSSPAARSSRSR